MIVPIAMWQFRIKQFFLIQKIAKKKQKIFGLFKSDESAAIFAVLRLIINNILKYEPMF